MSPPCTTVTSPVSICSATQLHGTTAVLCRSCSGHAVSCHRCLLSIIGLAPHERPYWRLLFETALLGVLAIVTHVSNSRVWGVVARSATGLALPKDRSFGVIPEGAVGSQGRPRKKQSCWAAFTSLVVDMAWLAMSFVYLVVLAVLYVYTAL